MTLDTRIYVLDRIDHRELFARCGQLIGADEGIKFTDDQDCAYGDADPLAQPWTIANNPGQNLCARLMVHYRPGAPLRTEAQASAHDMDCEGACYAEVSFDTAYGYRGPDGGCGDLHVRLVTQLGQWLDGRGIRWQWRNEFTGEVFWGYEGLDQLGSGGAQAERWFTGAVAPAIASFTEGKRS
jgi:hypothetical protein